jgi:hypothetical protein
MFLFSFGSAAKVDSLALFKLDRRFDSLHNEIALMAKDNQALIQQLAAFKSGADLQGNQSRDYNIGTMSLCGGLIAVFIGFFAFAAWLFDRKNDRELKAIQENIRHDLISLIAVDRDTLTQLYNSTISSLNTAEISVKGRVTQQYEDKIAEYQSILKLATDKQDKMFRERTVMVLNSIEADRYFEQGNVEKGIEYLCAKVRNIVSFCALAVETYPEDSFEIDLRLAASKLVEVLTPLSVVSRVSRGYIQTSASSVKWRNFNFFSGALDLVAQKKGPE